MSEIVKANVNKEIPIELLREDPNPTENNCISYNNKRYKLLKIIIVPKIWKGQGVLGFVILFFLTQTF